MERPIAAYAFGHLPTKDGGCVERHRLPPVPPVDQCPRILDQHEVMSCFLIRVPAQCIAELQQSDLVTALARRSYPLFDWFRHGHAYGGEVDQEQFEDNQIRVRILKLCHGPVRRKPRPHGFHASFIAIPSSSCSKHGGLRLVLRPYLAMSRIDCSFPVGRCSLSTVLMVITCSPRLSLGSV